MLKQWGWERLAGLLIVLLLHGGVIYGLWRAQLLPSPLQKPTTVFVNFINPAPPVPRVKPKSEPDRTVPPVPPKPSPARPTEPRHYHLAAQAPIVSPTEAVTQPPPAESPSSDPQPAVAPAPPAPVGPVTLAGELSVSCPVRTGPEYPARARRLGETGKVIVQVELDEDGRVAAAQILQTSASRLLDDAALSAVKHWRCNPAQRDGKAVRAIALQPFNFVIEGR